MSNRRTFTDDEVVTAMMIWEGMIDQRENIPDLQSRWEAVGTASMRDIVPPLVDAFDSLWGEMSDDGHDLMAPFDWEFVPWLLHQMDWGGGGAIPKDIKATLEAELVVRRGRMAVLHGR